MMNRTMTPDDDQHDRAGRPQDVGHGQDALDQVLDVDHVADVRIGAQRVADRADVRRVDQLDLEARVQRVGVEVAGQVLATLGGHRARGTARARRRGRRRRPTPPRASPRAWPRSASIWLGLGVRLEVADDLDLLLGELRGRPASPVWMIQKPASSRSIRTIVAVAARLITAFRQKPCHARRQAEEDERDHRSVLAVVGATDLVADDAALLERDDALAERGHDLGVVGGHHDRHAELVDPQQELEDLPADQRVEVAGRFVGDDQARVVDEGPGDGRALLLAARQLRGDLLRLRRSARPAPARDRRPARSCGAACP